MQKTLTLCFVCFILFSCEKDESTPVIYFEIGIDAQYKTDESDDWVVLHDKSNNLLAAKHFESGDAILFDSTVVIDQQFNVTLFRQQKSNADYYSAETFVGIEPGQVWTVLPTFPSTGGDLGADQGTITVSLTDPNLGSPFNVMVSNKHYDISPGTISSGTVSFTQSIKANSNDLFVFAADNAQNPKYLLLENVTAGSKTLSLQDLSNFEKTITVSFPQATTSSYAFVRGFENGDTYRPSGGYMTNFWFHGFNGGVYSNYKLGFTNRFTTHAVIVYAYQGSYDLLYESLGPAPAGNIELTKANVQLANKSFSDFAVNGTEFDWRKSYFFSSGSSGRTDWYIYSANDDVANYKLPDAFAQKFPTLSNGNLQHSSTQFTQGLDYATFIAEKFAGAEKKPRITRSTVIR